MNVCTYARIRVCGKPRFYGGATHGAPRSGWSMINENEILEGTLPENNVTVRNISVASSWSATVHLFQSDTYSISWTVVCTWINSIQETCALGKHYILWCWGWYGYCIKESQIYLVIGISVEDKNNVYLFIPGRISLVWSGVVIT